MHPAPRLLAAACVGACPRPLLGTLRRQGCVWRMWMRDRHHLPPPWCGTDA